MALASGRSGSAINKTGKRPRARSCSLSGMCRAAPKHRLGWRRNHRLKVSAVRGKKTGCENKRKQELMRSIHHRDRPISPQRRPPSPHPLSDPTVSSLGAKSARSDVCLLSRTSVTHGVLTVHFTSCLAASVCTNLAHSEDGAVLPSVWFESLFTPSANCKYLKLCSWS